MKKFNKDQLVDLFNKDAVRLNYGNPLKIIKCYENQKTLVASDDFDFILKEIAKLL